MARIDGDSELMTNLVSAVPVPAGSYFRTVLDEDRRPLVISVSNAEVPKLQLSKSTGPLHRQRSDGHKSSITKERPARSWTSVPAYQFLQALVS